VFALNDRWMGLLRTWWPMLATVMALVVGGVLALADRPVAAGVVWGVCIAGVTLSLVVEIVQQLRRREPGVDVIALLAMVGAILLGEFLAGAIIAWMLTTGRSLENGAEARARRELTALLAASPTRALAVLVVATPCPLILATPIATTASPMPSWMDQLEPDDALRELRTVDRFVRDDLLPHELAEEEDDAYGLLDQAADPIRA